MKRGLILLLLVVSLLGYNQANAQFDNPGLGYGFSSGGTQGVNSGADRWGMQYRGYLQYKILSPVLLGQIGVGYTRLRAPGVYSAQTVMADNRLLFIPFSLDNLNPFIYGGFGVSKAVDRSNSDYLPMVPVGVGIQTRIGNGILLEVSGGYNLSLSDKLDGRQRSNTDLNDVTNKKQDGFYGFSLGLIFAGSNANGDGDHDALSNRVEKELGTDPKNPDTDNDGLQDGAEFTQHKTDPLKADSDADGLNDGDEVTRFKTNPLLADTDADGLKDGNEVTEFHSNPIVADTDGDGLSDGDEANKFTSNMLKADTDGDALTDANEVNKHKSDPLKIDTDGGGMNDGAELARLTNVMDPKDDIVQRSTTIILEKGKKVIVRGINFEFGKATLTADSRTILEDAYKALVANADMNVEISGHTDFVGSEASNQDLSLRRAQAVKNWLVTRGISSNRMKTVGRGENEPVADNSTDGGRGENRRIEFFVQQ